MKKLLFITLFLGTTGLQAQYIASFENTTLGTDSHINGSAGDSLFTDQGFLCPIIWDQTWNFWAGGWALSNETDSSRRGTDGLFQSITESGYLSDNYLIGQQGSEIVLETPVNTPMHSMYITNISFVYHSLLEGDQFSKKFGGANGTDPDYLLLHILAKDNGVWKPDTVHFFLADYRSNNAAEDYVIDEWTLVDLSKLGKADTLMFFMESSDTGEFGINTPTYFAIDALSRDWNTTIQTPQKSPLVLYPNPATEFLQLENVVNWSILDIQGRILLKGRDKNIDIRSLNSGIYLLQDNNGNSARFIKK